MASSDGWVTEMHPDKFAGRTCLDGLRGRSMALRGGDSDEEEFGPERLIQELKDINLYRTTDGFTLESKPQFSLRTADQDEGVVRFFEEYYRDEEAALQDYGAHGFMFNILAHGDVVITGIQICAADGGP
eukprot:471713-Hanusia_phi.AAC.3